MHVCNIKVGALAVGAQDPSSDRARPAAPRAASLPPILDVKTFVANAGHRTVTACTRRCRPPSRDAALAWARRCAASCPREPRGCRRSSSSTPASSSPRWDPASHSQAVICCCPRSLPTSPSRRSALPAQGNGTGTHRLFWIACHILTLHAARTQCPACQSWRLLGTAPVSRVHRALPRPVYVAGCGSCIYMNLKQNLTANALPSAYIVSQRIIRSPNDCTEPRKRLGTSRH